MFNKKTYNVLAKMILLVVIVGIIMNILPNITSFNYKYEVGRVWDYPSLETPYSFPIYKSHDQIAKEKLSITNNIRPFYAYDSKKTEENIKKFQHDLYKIDSYDSILYYSEFTHLDTTFAHIMRRGIIKLDDNIDDKDSSYILCIENGKNARFSFLDNLYFLSDAVNTFRKQSAQLPTSVSNDVDRIATAYMTENIALDKKKTEAEMIDRFANYSETYGMILKGTVIISEGEIVTEDIFNNLNSLKVYYESHALKSTSFVSRFATFLFYIVIILSFFVFLYIFQPEYVVSNRSFLIISLTIGLIVFAAYFLESFFHRYIYLVPICIVPIVFRAFFDYKVSLWGLIFTVLLVAMVIPDGFYYAIANIITGIIVISCMSKLEKRSQYFSIAFVILLSYLSFNLLTEFTMNGDILNLDFNVMLNYSVNSFLTLIAFPLIFYIEKISGMTTDISLIEYSNTNNKILRELSTIAPGTFQHSIQVANLAENAARKIGANVLLTRVGSLYHDIGKMYKPYYFSENQSKNSNPHDALLPEESASILIGHVNNGVEIASKHRLPDNIKDFIRSHHGTRLTSFFYTKAIEQEGAAKVDEKNFRYRGPKPFSRETAIVMMADSVEAVSKTLTTPDEQSIVNLVNKTINRQIEEKQFDNADITFKEIEEIKNVFISSLKTSFHLRVKYPS